ncbi:MAG: NapC/NirT family cytochrome c [bacterium]|nr:NapC/NirT family cytochrome c [bacterium]
MHLTRLLAWLRSVDARVRALPRLLAATVMVSGIVVAAAGVLGAARSYDYTMNNPEFCRSCHTMEAAWTAWQKSEHRKVECHSCHAANVVESARQVITFVVRQPRAVGKHAVVPKAVCARCHESNDPRWLQVATTPGHRLHEQERRIECVTCHSPGIHRFKPPVAVCGNCHVAQARGERAVQIRAMADQHCVTCHEFLRPEVPLQPVRETCLNCHRLVPKEVGSWPAGAPMQFACAQCHKPHEQRQPIVACATCHAEPKAELHPAAVLKSTPCTACHIPHRWSVGR